MPIRVTRKLLIQPGDMVPSSDGLEVIGTFNPGVVRHNGDVVLMVRVAEKPCERRDGFAALPYWRDGRIEVEWVRDDELEPLDARVVRHKEDGLLRLTFTSHLRVVRSHDGYAIHDRTGSRLLPAEPWEEFGIEDPRIIKLNDRYWITYVAVSRHGVATALASTSDFIAFERHGIIFCPENKDVVLFPEKIGDRFVALHRPTTAHAFCRPEIWLSQSPDLFHWGSHRPLLGGGRAWETDRVGAGTPPLKTDSGWLEIYHACRRSNTPGQVGEYVAGALLLDLDNPTRVLGRTRQPLWKPDAPHELDGFIPRVVFPTGIVVRGDILHVYYGAADTNTGIAELPLHEAISLCTGFSA
jgi:predicted GH43/DUF377 family glycosyl hydrolase